MPKNTCFILPSYHVSTDTHFGYTLTLFESFASRNKRTALFIEDPTSDTYSNKIFEKVVQQSISVKPFNLLERYYLLLRLILDGTRTFYIHYSYFSLFYLLLLKPLFGLHLYFWHAELYKKSDFGEMTFTERLLLKTALKCTPNILTATQTLKTGYAQVFEIDSHKIAVVPNWVEPQSLSTNVATLRKKYDLKKSDKILLFVHRLSPRKGAHLLPQIVQELEQKNLHFKLLILGNGPLKKSLKKSFAKNPQVHLLGAVSHTDIRAYFELADVFIMPSLREGAPRVILESMLYKVPFASTKVGSVVEMSSKEQKPFISATGDPKVFAQSIFNMLSSDTQKLIEANYQKVRDNYSLDVAVEKLEKAIS